jgi:hypothetical protein
MIKNRQVEKTKTWIIVKLNFFLKKSVFQVVHVIQKAYTKPIKNHKKLL